MIDDFLWLAYYEAKKSPDPSTQLGAVLVDRNGQIISRSWNQFPRGCKLTNERLVRPLKYQFIVHAEHSTILKAARVGYATGGCTLYCPWFACMDCAKAIVTSGIAKVVGHKQMFDRVPNRWNESIEVGNMILDEAGVIREYYDGLIQGIDVLIDGVRWTT